MLSTEQFPSTNEDWEELDVSQCIGTRWKTTHRAAAKKALIKKKSASRKDQFGVAHTVTPPLGDDTAGNTAGKNQPMGLAALNGYFNNIAAAATNEKAILEELATNLTTLTTSNAEMAATINKIRVENRKLQQKLNRSKTLPQDKYRPGRRQSAVGNKLATCPNCKQEVWHNLDDCFELEKNAARRPSVWTTRL